MSSKPSSPRSITSQLVLLFTLAASLLFCCGLGLLYLIVVRHAFEEDNEVLADKVSALRADLDNAGGPGVLREELKLVRSGERIAYWVRVLDSAGQVVAETPGIETLLPAAVFPSLDKAAAENTTPQKYRTRGRLFALFTIAEVAGGETYAVQVAQDRSQDEQFTRRFGALLAAVLAFGIIASALIAINVTKRGLRPLAQMAQSLERIGPKRLHERVPPEGWPRELRPVAIAFDEMMDRLEDSFTRLSQFSADLAHELRTPIANLRGEAEVALTRPRPPEEYKEVIESSVAECERLSGIIDNLLFLARAEAADAAVERKVFDGLAAIAKIANYYETIAEDRQVTIVSSGEGQVHAEPVLFGRAVSNLVDNALRHSRGGGTIAIAIAENDEAATISVKDTGAGISAEHLPRIFDRFYRADTSRSSQGTGLGLSLVKSIMTLHGGAVEVASEVARGTSVTLSFPRQHSSPAPGVSPPA